jgi:hypothetical protein
VADAPYRVGADDSAKRGHHWRHAGCTVSDSDISVKAAAGGLDIPMPQYVALARLPGGWWPAAPTRSKVDAFSWTSHLPDTTP